MGRSFREGVVGGEWARQGRPDRKMEDLMKIQVLGTGCPKCRKTLEHAEQAARECAVDASVEKVDRIHEIMEFGVFTTPALAIDGTVRIAGRVPSVEEIKSLLTDPGRGARKPSGRTPKREGQS